MYFFCTELYLVMSSKEGRTVALFISLAKSWQPQLVLFFCGCYRYVTVISLKQALTQMSSGSILLQCPLSSNHH